MKHRFLQEQDLFTKKKRNDTTERKTDTQDASCISAFLFAIDFDENPQRIII